FSVCVHVVNTVTLAKLTTLFTGSASDLQFTQHGYYISDPYTVEDNEETPLRGALCPKAGLKLSFTDNLALSLQSQYSFTLGAAGDTKNVVHHFFSIGMGLLVKL